MDKPIYKSKTIISISVIIVIVILSLFGVGEAEIAKTIDSMGTEQNTESIKEIITLIATAVAIYGRAKVGKGKKDGQ